MLIMYCQMEIFKSKLYPDIFLYAAKKLSIEPANCLVIEDSENGVNAAKNAADYIRLLH